MIEKVKGFNYLEIVEYFKIYVKLLGFNKWIWYWRVYIYNYMKKERYISKLNKKMYGEV